MQHPGEPIRPRQRRPLPGADDQAETRAVRSTRVLIRVPQVTLSAPTSEAKPVEPLANRPGAKPAGSSRTVGGIQGSIKSSGDSEVPAPSSTDDSSARQAGRPGSKSYRVDEAHTAMAN